LTAHSILGCGGCSDGGGVAAVGPLPRLDPLRYRLLVARRHSAILPLLTDIAQIYHFPDGSPLSIMRAIVES